jgi:hypothetical protein
MAGSSPALTTRNNSRPGIHERHSSLFMLLYSNPAPRAHLYFAPSTSTGISVE